MMIVLMKPPQKYEKSISNSPNIKLMHRVGRRGLSGAVIEGILSVSADIVIVMDCDLQHKEKNQRNAS